MLEWLTDNNKDSFLKLLGFLREYTKAEIKTASQMSNAFEEHKQMEKLVGDENVEKQLEHHLVAEFIKRKAELMEKSEALTLRLEALVGEIREKVEQIFEDLVELETALENANKGKIKAAKRVLLDHLLELEKGVKNAEEISRYLQEFEVIPNVFCTEQFKKKLKTREFRGRIKEITGLLQNMNPGWLATNSKKLQDYEFFVFPQGRTSSLRVIYKVEDGRYVIYDLFTHNDYIRTFKRGLFPRYRGLFKVTRPLKLFAAGA